MASWNSSGAFRRAWNPGRRSVVHKVDEKEVAQDCDGTGQSHRCSVVLRHRIRCGRPVRDRIARLQDDTCVEVNCSCERK
jgi:hypothetical protein